MVAMSSAREARGLSDGVRNNADQAAASMSRLSEAMEKIKDSSDQTAKIVKTMDEIAAGADQQNHGIAQINSAMEQINQMTQRTAANAEESRSALEELTSQAKELSAMVSEDRINSRNASGSRRTAPARKATSLAGRTSPTSVGERLWSSEHPTAFDEEEAMPVLGKF